MGIWEGKPEEEGVVRKLPPLCVDLINFSPERALGVPDRGCEMGRIAEQLKMD